MIGPDDATLIAVVTRTLTLSTTLPDGASYISAASGLTRVRDDYVVAADDAHHIAVFACDSDRPGRSLRVIAGDLPDEHRERKRSKPDFEAVLAVPPTPGLPTGAVVVVGSGSTANRDRAVVIPFDPDGHLGATTRTLSLSGVYEPLRTLLGEINVEAAFCVDGEVVLISRGHGGAPDNHIARFDLDRFAAWLSGEIGAVECDGVTSLRLPELAGVPLTITDADAHPEGGWVFSAVCEDTGDSYNDGAVTGAAVGVVDRDGRLAWLGRLEPELKVEGIHANQTADGVRLTMVTDADDPSVPAVMLEATLPRR